MHKKRLVTGTVAITVVMIVAIAGAQDLTIDWYTVDGGGGYSAGGDFELDGTIGQPDAGVTMSGGDVTLAGGYWAGGQVPGPDLPGDCDGDGSINSTDFAFFEACLLGPDASFGTSCGCTDFDADSDTDLADVAAFQTHVTGP
jgi:hypothetical protein